jgi:hypothetical protein
MKIYTVVKVDFEGLCLRYGTADEEKALNYCREQRQAILDARKRVQECLAQHPNIEKSLPDYDDYDADFFDDEDRLRIMLERGIISTEDYFLHDEDPLRICIQEAEDSEYKCVCTRYFGETESIFY